MTQQDVLVKLSRLTSEFLDAREAARRNAEPYDPESTTCRYCRRRWVRWHGSKLDGHAGCIVGDDFKLSLTTTMIKDAALTIPAVASALGVTVAVVRSWTFPLNRR